MEDNNNNNEQEEYQHYQCQQQARQQAKKEGRVQRPLLIDMIETVDEFIKSFLVPTVKVNHFAQWQQVKAHFTKVFGVGKGWMYTWGRPAVDQMKVALASLLEKSDLSVAAAARREGKVVEQRYSGIKRRRNTTIQKDGRGGLTATTSPSPRSSQQQQQKKQRRERGQEEEEEHHHHQQMLTSNDELTELLQAKEELKHDAEDNLVLPPPPQPQPMMMMAEQVAMPKREEEEDEQVVVCKMKRKPAISVRRYMEEDSPLDISSSVDDDGAGVNDSRTVSEDAMESSFPFAFVNQLRQQQQEEELRTARDFVIVGYESASAMSTALSSATALSMPPSSSSLTTSSSSRDSEWLLKMVMSACFPENVFVDGAAFLAHVVQYRAFPVASRKDGLATAWYKVFKAAEGRLRSALANVLVACGHHQPTQWSYEGAAAVNNYGLVASGGALERWFDRDLTWLLYQARCWTFASWGAFERLLIDAGHFAVETSSQAELVACSRCSVPFAVHDFLRGGYLQVFVCMHCFERGDLNHAFMHRGCASAHVITVDPLHAAAHVTKCIHCGGEFFEGYRAFSEEWLQEHFPKYAHSAVGVSCVNLVVLGGFLSAAVSSYRYDAANLRYAQEKEERRRAWLEVVATRTVVRGGENAVDLQ